MLGGSPNSSRCTKGFISTSPHVLTFPLQYRQPVPTLVSLHACRWSLWLQFLAVVAAIALYFFSCLKPFSLTIMYYFLMSSVLLFFQANQSFTA